MNRKFLNFSILTPLNQNFKLKNFSTLHSIKKFKNLKISSIKKFKSNHQNLNQINLNNSYLTQSESESESKSESKSKSEYEYEHEDQDQSNSNQSFSVDSNNFLLDPTYIKRYRDPERHDDYIIPDHHHPYEFRTRPNSTQFNSSNHQPRNARIKMENSWLSTCISSNHSSNSNLIKPKLGLCFPGSSCQYLGMGSFLKKFKTFNSIWLEAEEALINFETWRNSLNLIQKFKDLGYNDSQANLLGGPMKKGALLSNLNHSINLGLKHVVFNGPQNELTRSSNAQPAILISSLAYLKTLEIDGQFPIQSLTNLYAGHSSGEYTACVASNVIKFSTGVQLTRLLGLLTTRALQLYQILPSTFSHASDHSRAQMSALLINSPNHSIHDLIFVIKNLKSSDPALKVQIASINSNQQVVLTGTRFGVLAASSKLHDLDIAHRAADLPCSSPFHSSFMKPAAQGMKIALDSIQFSPPTKPIVITSPFKDSSYSSNFNHQNLEIDPFQSYQTRLINSKEDLDYLKLHLSQSIHQPVYWTKTIQRLLSKKSQLSNHHDHHLLNKLIFIGPGKALNNLCKKEILYNKKISNQSTNQPQQDDQEIEISSLATLDDFDKLRLLKV